MRVCEVPGPWICSGPPGPIANDLLAYGPPSWPSNYFVVVKKGVGVGYLSLTPTVGAIDLGSIFGVLEEEIGRKPCAISQVTKGRR